MVRTKADSCPAAGRKVVVARAPRKCIGASSSTASGNASSGTSPAGSKYAGGNPVCPRPTPEWQKGIGSFFERLPSNKDDEKLETEAGSSSGSVSCEAGNSSSFSCTPEPCGSSSSGRTTEYASRQSASVDNDDKS